MAYGTVNADVIGTSVAGSNLGAGNASIMKNRLINGSMVIDQRNAGASVTPANGDYTLDRWRAGLSASSKYSVQQNAGSVTPPTGFSNYLGVTSLSAYTVGADDYFIIQQPIEGFNFADLGYGTANAKTTTISFWVRSSLTGTFGGSFTNSSYDYGYPFTYTISAANTWQQISVTIAGPTSGTWVGSTNGIGLRLLLGLGVGSNRSFTAGSWQSGNVQAATGATSVVGTSGATFYITGVQLEVGSSATGFEYRQYTTEFSLCQRYYEVIGSSSTSIYVESNSSGTPFAITGNWSFAVQKRTTPTMATTGTFTASNTSGSLAFNSGTGNFNAYYLAASSGRAYWLNNAGGTITASAEL